MGEHTPGPWHVHMDSGHVLNDAGTQVLWTEPKEALSGDKGIVAKAEDWRIIIAAPDLLVALEADTKWLEHLWSCRQCRVLFIDCPTGAELKKVAAWLQKTALAKAKGE